MSNYPSRGSEQVKNMSGFVDVQGLYEKCKELKKDDVQMLREWTEKQPHLPKISGRWIFCVKINSGEIN